MSVVIGPLMLDVAGLNLTEDDKEVLANPYVGGIIFFARNYQDPEQLINLVNEVRAINPNILIAVDQEGGRVQRLKEGFTLLPPLAKLGELYDRDPAEARRLAEIAGWLMATEVLSVGVDFSFAPVLDLNYGVSEIIGNRSFHQDPNIAADLAQLYIFGMEQAGMRATGKHFPGHGFVAPDSHLEIPVDERELSEILSTDVIPFKKTFMAGLAAVMPAHIVFPKVDELPVGFSSKWLQDILRKELDFRGVIFSDDLTMEGASGVGSYPMRAKKALDAGCDMILVCNNREAALEVLEALPSMYELEDNPRLNKMCGIQKIAYDLLKENPNYLHAVEEIKKLN